MWNYFIFFSLIFLLKVNSYVTQHNKTNHVLYARNEAVKLLSDNIHKPDNDHSSYRLIELSNGLKTLLISNPSSKDAAAALNVKVGHFSDPDDIPGIAHFCEHLVFMGTKKYPGENAYSDYMISHSGYYNAATSTDYTEYFFDIPSQHFEKGLDMFAQLFISPLFSKGSVEREARVVDMEHKKNLKSDSWRLFQLEKSISNKKSPYSKFGTGSYVTLVENTRKKNIDIVAKVSEFFSTYYSSRLMTLVIFSPDSLDKLQDLAVKYFSEIPDRGTKRPTFTEKPFESDVIGKQYWYKPIADKTEMELVFPIKTQEEYYKSDPVAYLKYFLEHQADGSVYSALKEEGWATSIEVDSEYIVSGTDALRIHVFLTSEGLDNYENVVTLIFGYLEMLKQKGPQEWVFRELINMDTAKFRFKDPLRLDTYVALIAEFMQKSHIGYSDLLKYNYVSEYNNEHIENLLDMLDVKNYFLVIISKTKPNFWDLREPWYNSEYKVEPFGKTLIEKTNKLNHNASFKLPSKNEFIPEHFIIKKPSDQKINKPFLIYNDSSIRYWYKQDDTFSTPKTSMHVFFKIPDYSFSPFEAVQAAVYFDMLHNSMSETIYYATVAGYKVNLSVEPLGIYISLYGFSDKIILLLGKILEFIIRFTPSESSYMLSKHKVTNDYVNNELSMPYKYVPRVFFHLSSQLLWPSTDLIHSVKSLTYIDILAFHTRSFSSVFLEILAVGALSNSTHDFFKANLKQIFRTSQYPLQLLPPRSYVLRKGSNYIYELTSANPVEPNSVVLYSIQIGSSRDLKSRALLTLLSTITKTPAFDQLRTKEQLCYVVKVVSIDTDPLLSFVILIQSLRDPFYLEQRVNAFLYRYAAVIDTMTEEQFKKHVDVFVVSKVPQYKHVHDEASEYMNIINTGFYDFNRSAEMINALKSLTKDDLKKFYYEHIYPSSSDRKKLSVHLRSQSLEEVSVLDLSPRRLHYYLKCKGMEVSLGELYGLMDSTFKLEDLQKKIKELLKKKYPNNKNVSKVVSQAFVYLKELYKKLKQEAIKDYDAVHFTDAAAFKGSLRLSPAPLHVLPWKEYYAN